MRRRREEALLRDLLAELRGLREDLARAKPEPVDHAAAIVQGREFARSGVGKQVREEAGLSLADIGKALGVDPAAVFHWEAGNKRPNHNNARHYRDLILSVQNGKA